MEKMIFTLTEQMKDAIQLLQRTVTVKKISGGVYPEGVLFYKDNLAVQGQSCRDLIGFEHHL